MTPVPSRSTLMPRLLATWALLWAAFAPPAWALDADLRLNQFQHRAWTAADGAPTETWAMTQSTDGQIWMGGPGGLLRFDGVRFERFPASRSTPFPAGAVLRVMAASNGDLWVSFLPRGLVRIRQGQVWQVPESEPVTAQRLRYLSEDAEGRIWVGGESAFFRFDGQRWARADELPGFGGMPLGGLVVDGRGTVWVCARDRLLQALPRGAASFQTVGDCTDARSLPVVDGQAWIVDAKTARRLPEVSRAPMLPGLSWAARRSSPTWIDRGGNLWSLFCPAGLCRRTLPISSTDRAAVAGTDPIALPEPTERMGAAEGLSGDFGMTMMEDVEGNLWVATKTGLDRFRRAALVPAALPRGTSNYALAAEPDGSVWAAASATGAYSKWRLSGVGEATRLPAPEAQVTAVGRDAQGRLLMGGSTGLWRREGERWVELPRPVGAQGRWVLGLAAHGQGVLASFQKLGVQRFEDGVWQPLTVPGETGPIEAAMAVAPDGAVWLGLKDNRVLRLKDGALRRLGPAEGVDVGDPFLVHAGRTRVLVAGDRGVDVLRGDRFVPLMVDSADALTGVSGIVETANGDLWLNGRKGAVQVTKADLDAFLADPRRPLRHVLIDALEGYPVSATSFWPQPSVVEAADGRLWFAGITGVAWLDPRHPRRNPVAPVARVTGVRADGVEYPAGAPLRLPINSSMLELRFSAASLSIPERVRFRYRLEGMDRGWRDTTTRRETMYTNLGPGRYTFRVQAFNNDGVPAAEEATQLIEIPAAFYQTLWFRAACVLAAAALIWVLHRLRMRQAANAAREKLRTRLAERERIARELHDTLLQGVQGLILRFEANAARLPADHPARAAMAQDLALADEVLDESRRRVMALRGSPEAGGSLSRDLEDVASQLARDYDGECRVVVDGRERPLKPEVREELRMIFGEALLNAFRHAGAARMTLSLRYGWWGLRVTLDDDGRGIAPEVLVDGRPGHLGLAAMRERAKGLGARWSVTSQMGKGTTVALWLRASRAYVTDTALMRDAVG
jgi:signal transduction histidine kinase/ligand-binding sensor domain-containing protein